MSGEGAPVAHGMDPVQYPQEDVLRLREAVEDMVDQIFDEGGPPRSVRGALMGAAVRGYAIGMARAKEKASG